MEARPRLIEWTEAPLGFFTCGGGSVSLAHELLGAQLEMEADLVIGLVARAIGAAQREVEETKDARANLAVIGFVAIGHDSQTATSGLAVRMSMSVSA